MNRSKADHIIISFHEAIRTWHRRRHDSIDFAPLLQRTSHVAQISAVVADHEYDSEQNHLSAQNIGISRTIICPKYETLQVYKIKGFHRKNMKRNFDWDTYRQRSKTERQILNST